MPTINTDDLSKEIDEVFPLVEMPPNADLSVHLHDCDKCAYVREELEFLRGKEIPGNTIRLLHQEIDELSALSWRWILPHYLRFCLTPEAAYNQMETQFLIYNLRPEPEFQKSTLERFSLLNKKQVECLIHFLDWCAENPAFNVDFSSDIEKGQKFLSNMMSALKN